MPDLQGKTIILGVTGGVAAYKTAELTRLLRKAGARVRVVMSEAAQQFVGSATFQALSGESVLSGMWQDQGNGMTHIYASRDADLILVAPATADFLARLACGRADDLLSALCLARSCPLYVAPAMNPEMWANPATIRNAAQLRTDGVYLLGPEAGDTACGETGPGRMREPADLLVDLASRLSPGALAGKTVLITAGPTYEPIDPVRGLTNLSSGKMGYALARAAHEAGAQVTLVSGPTCLPTPTGVSRVNVTRAAEMRDAVMERVGNADIFIAVAAVADYAPSSSRPQKIKRGTSSLTLQLELNPDILEEVVAGKQAPYCVGFAAETEALEDHAQAKRRKKNLPLLVGNLAQDTLGGEDAALILFDEQGAHPLPKADKLSCARRLVSEISLRLRATKT
ncbi:MAG TPA: bifunctional phosphopantothenoylcysteine decarboxylase/phosphopantothenate--cysteine ligase CoaBC [Thiobacillaceae bacterium]|nr:bifunctional phosphopantothenoylcysteine decarboxylase/phosphopantothenate--cysteine ligase CoaBC [Thiobacillaceae bacterium]